MIGALPFVLVLALGVAQGGFFPDSWVWATPLAAWAAALVAVLGTGGGALRREWAWPLVALALTGWTALSALWSIESSQSLLEARRTALYATVVLALLSLARRYSARDLVVATHAALTLLMAYALARYLANSRAAAQGTLLAQPLGYANAAGILATLGILLALGLARRHRVALVTVPLFAADLWLSGSRGSVLALAVGIAVLLLRSARLSRRVAIAVSVVAIAVVAASAVHTGATEPRASYWRVAWHHEVLTNPALGTGAGTFGLQWLRYGDVARFQGALDTHSLYLETLGELGPVGLLLTLGLLLWPLRRVRSASPAALAAYAAFLVHAGVDWDWEMPAVVVAGLACAAACLLGDGEQPEPPPPAARAAVAATALVLGAYGIAGVRSSTVPSARERAPQSGALAHAWRRSRA